MDHDKGYKLLFSHPEMVRDLLKGFVHQEWVEHIDLDSLEKCSGTYVSDDLRNREDDIIWRVKVGPDWVYVYLLIEFQSSVERFMAVRILTYIGLLYQDLIRSGEVGPTNKLPAVLPIVLYNGEPRWTAPDSLHSLMGILPKGLEKYQPEVQYLLIDEGRFSDTELASQKNLCAALFRLENSQGPEAMARILEALIEWLKDPAQDSLKRSFTVWLKRVLLKNNNEGQYPGNLNDLEEVHSMLSERVKRWTEEWKHQGWIEGKLEGKEEGKLEGKEEGKLEGKKEGEAEFLLRLMERRFGPLSEVEKLKINSASSETLLLWGDRFVTAESLNQILDS